MIVTINADASYSNKYKVGTYANYIVCNQFRHMVSRPFSSNIYELDIDISQRPLKNSTDAECAAICNALYFLKSNKGIIGRITKIVINTDSLSTIKKVNRRAKVDSIYYQCLILLRELRADNNPKSKEQFFKFNHIKSHVSKSKRTPAQHVNEWCDKQAKIEMGKLIKMMELKQDFINKLNANHEHRNSIAPDVCSQAQSNDQPQGTDTATQTKQEQISGTD